MGGTCAVTMESVRPDPPGGLEADSRQTCYLLPETPLRKMSGGITAAHQLPLRPVYGLCLHFHEQPPNTVQVTFITFFIPYRKWPYGCKQPLSNGLIWAAMENLFSPKLQHDHPEDEVCLKVLPRQPNGETSHLTVVILCFV